MGRWCLGQKQPLASSSTVASTQAPKGHVALGVAFGFGLRSAPISLTHSYSRARHLTTSSLCSVSSAASDISRGKYCRTVRLDRLPNIPLEYSNSPTHRQRFLQISTSCWVSSARHRWHGYRGVEGAVVRSRGPGWATSQLECLPQLSHGKAPFQNSNRMALKIRRKLLG